MDEQEQIKKMLSKLKSGYFCQPDCYGCCGDGYLDITCNIVVDNFIKELHNAGYQKIPEGAVVLTKEEYDELTLTKQSIFDMLEERDDKARKETAKEILQDLYNYPHEYHEKRIVELAKQFGVEIKE